MVNVFVIGMAGSGKTTFLQRLNSELHKQKNAPYVLNLDPAVRDTPYATNIDIRDSVNYSKVMEDYGLGPNGAIMTSLNLFSTKIDQVVGLVEKRQETHDYIVVDTPGQIECFIWSASGQIITDAFASAGPTIIAYIMDTPRCSTPATFMSNMLYACSILYKTKLPMVVVFNKIDQQDSAFVREWMSDFMTFQQALNENGNEESYMSSLMTSMSLVLEEFYNALDVCSVSSVTGEGFDEFFTAVDKKKHEFETEYAAERERVLKLHEEKEAERKANDLTRLLRDVGVEKTDPLDVVSDQEEEDDDEDDAGDDAEGGAAAESEADRSAAAKTTMQSRYEEALSKTSTAEERAAVEKIISESTRQKN